jgi:cbb3-type cytochrome oxidase subunit 3
MFKQIKDLAGGEFYLITSLLLFMVFFIMVGIYLLKLSKKHAATMSNLPIHDQQALSYEED